MAQAILHSALPHHSLHFRGDVNELCLLRCADLQLNAHLYPPCDLLFGPDGTSGIVTLLGLYCQCFPMVSGKSKAALQLGQLFDPQLCKIDGPILQSWRCSASPGLAG